MVSQLMVALLKDLEDIVREFLLPSEDRNYRRMMRQFKRRVGWSRKTYRMYLMPGYGFARYLLWVNRQRRRNWNC